MPEYWGALEVGIPVCRAEIIRYSGQFGAQGGARSGDCRVRNGELWSIGLPEVGLSGCRARKCWVLQTVRGTGGEAGIVGYGMRNYGVRETSVASSPECGRPVRPGAKCGVPGGEPVFPGAVLRNNSWADVVCGEFPWVPDNNPVYLQLDNGS